MEKVPLRRMVALATIVLGLTGCKQCGHGSDPDIERPTSRPAKPPQAPALFRGLIDGGRWVLVESTEGEDRPREPRQLRLAATPLSAVGAIRVARLSWTLEGPGDTTTTFAAENNPANLPLHVAATGAGLFLLDPEGQAADIKRAVVGRPDYSASPRPIPQRSRPDGTYVVESKFNGRMSYCFGEGSPPGSSPPECDDCEGMICFAEGAGIVHLSGSLAPDKGVFSLAGFEG
jgi:hypothetical protein